MTITKSDDTLRITLDIPLTMKGEYTYGDGEWTMPAVCMYINDKFQEYSLNHTIYLDYKDSLQTGAMIVAFGSKEEALKVAEDFNLPIMYAQ